MRSTAPGKQVREEKVPFSDLQGLLDACVQHAEGEAFVRVQISGTSAGQRRRLVLDFGYFGRDEE
ncbi:MAG TPA: hypothetical protein VFE90_24580 [Myxococcales bacterium]|nr:hypothetical protein [Myxococcales bacterium]